MTDYKNMIEEISPDGNAELDSEVQHEWGKRFNLSIDQAPVDIPEIFPRSEILNQVDTGVDENFSNCSIIMVEGEIEEGDYEGQKYFIVGYTSAGEYSDEDFEGNFSGDFFLLADSSEEKIAAARKDVEKHFAMLAQSEIRKKAKDIVDMSRSMDNEMIGRLLESDEFLAIQRIFARAA